MEGEINHIKQLYPEATYAGVADGATCNWEFLGPHTDFRILDFYHATEYLADAAEAAFPRHKAQREKWFEERCHRLKHKQGAAARILKEMEALSDAPGLSIAVRQKLDAAITYFSNHKHQIVLAPKCTGHEICGFVRDLYLFASSAKSVGEFWLG